MSSGSSFAAASQRFASQSARHRRPLSLATVQPYGGTGMATPEGPTVCVFLSPERAERILTETGERIDYVAQLRVLKSAAWAPTVDVEFVVVATGRRYRLRTATGADSNFPAEIVGEAVRVQP